MYIIFWILLADIGKNKLSFLHLSKIIQDLVRQKKNRYLFQVCREMNETITGNYPSIIKRMYFFTCIFIDSYLYIPVHCLFTGGRWNDSVCDLWRLVPRKSKSQQETMYIKVAGSETLWLVYRKFFKILVCIIIFM